MKKIIGFVAFASIGLFGFTRETPSAQADTAAAAAPSAGKVDRGCTIADPICCEPTGTGCLVCIKFGQECP